MVRTLKDISADKKPMAEEEKKTLKSHKKDAFATVKKLIVESNMTLNAFILNFSLAQDAVFERLTLLVKDF